MKEQTFRISFPTLVTVKRDDPTRPLTAEERDYLTAEAWKQLERLTSVGSLINDYWNPNDKTQYGGYAK